ncbi:MAG: hypothetical protein AAF992_24635 [Bacteroidota bacterium]
MYFWLRMAVADKLGGPYQFEAKLVTFSDGMIEYAYAFTFKNMYYLFSRTKKIHLRAVLMACCGSHPTEWYLTSQLRSGPLSS